MTKERKACIGGIWCSLNIKRNNSFLSVFFCDAVSVWPLFLSGTTTFASEFSESRYSPCLCPLLNDLQSILSASYENTSVLFFNRPREVEKS